MALFLIARLHHVRGALAMFAALGTELAAPHGVTRARSAGAAPAALEGYRLNRVPGPMSALLIPVPSGYPAASTSGMTPWIWGTLGALVAIIVLGAAGMQTLPAATGPALQRAFDGFNVDRLIRRMRASLVARTALLLGIVMLMTTKPDRPGTLLTVGAFVAFVVVVRLLPARGGRTRRAVDTREEIAS